MQEREGTPSLKRTREEESSPVPAQAEASRPLPLRPSENFEHSFAQNGDGKAFWYFKSLIYEVNNNRGFLASPDFHSSNGDVWNLLLYPSKTKGYLGLYVQLKPSYERLGYKKRANVFIEVFLTGGRLERKVQSSFTEEFSFARRDWGYDKFLKHADFHGYLSKPVVFEVTVSPFRPHEESKAVSGYNGINNEGTTCYINSLLQTLFFIKAFRKAVYQMPTSEKDQDRIPLSLQLIFFHLQHADVPASTRDLLKSFGWTSDQWHVQHDVQEFNCILSDTLEKKMKGTASEGTYAKLFIGKMKNVIECAAVAFQSERTEFFNDLQLNVKGCSSILESFEKYTEVEVLDGDNMYEAEGHGKQVAHRRVLFEYLPPVLQLQLKRFEYNYEFDHMVKLNQFYRVDQAIDLAKFVTGSGDWNYSLFSILVHRGTAQAGHYFSYIRPCLRDKWFVFNDDSVDPVITSYALTSSFGGEVKELQINELGFIKEVQTNSEACAYMLVYIQTDKAAEILADITNEDIPRSLREIYESEVNKKTNEEKHKEMKDTLLDVYVTANEIIAGWDLPGIANPDSDIYSINRFSANSRIRARIEIRKDCKAQELYDSISKYVKSPVKLWVFAPGFTNWQLKELALNENLQKQVHNKAVFIETSEKVFEYIKEFSRWEFINSGSISPCSQGTEILDDELEIKPKVLLVFKWFDYNDGFPVLTTLKAESVLIKDLEKLRDDLFMVKFGKVNEGSLKVQIFVEKALSRGKDQPEVKLFPWNKNFEVIHGSNSKDPNQLDLSHGDCVIGQSLAEEGTVSPAEYIQEKFESVSLTFLHYNKLQNWGFDSFSSNLLHQQSSNSSFVKVDTKLSYSEAKLVNQLIEAIGLEGQVEDKQIELFTEEGHFFNPLSRDPKRLVRNLVSINSHFGFDIVPNKFGSSDDYSTVYCVLVDDKFRKLKQYCKVIKKPAKVKCLEEALYEDILQDLNLNMSKQVKFFLLNYPQMCIVKELESDDYIEKIASQSFSYICWKGCSDEDNVREFTEEKVFVYVFRKGEDKGSSAVEYFNKAITCSDLIKEISAKFDEKVRVLLCEKRTIGERFELKPNRVLEDTDFMFFERNSEKHIAVELPYMGNGKNQLKINMN